VRDASGTELIEAHEASWIIAIIRRFADLGPDWASLLSWLPFNFVLRRGEEGVGTYKRVLESSVTGTSSSWSRRSGTSTGG
jgi:hypothetical protein